MGPMDLAVDGPVLVNAVVEGAEVHDALAEEPRVLGAAVVVADVAAAVVVAADAAVVVAVVDVVAEGSLPPEVADRDEESTWTAKADYDSDGYATTRPCENTLGKSMAEKVEMLRAELADHGPTCSRNLVAA